MMLDERIGTNWSLFEVKPPYSVNYSWSSQGLYTTRPGFFTPFTRDMGLGRALQAVISCPLLQLQNTVMCLLTIPIVLIRILACVIMADSDAIKSELKDLFKITQACLYSFTHLFLELLKESVSLITRTMASFYHLSSYDVSDSSTQTSVHQI